jgi:uncharacterized membrane protein HdeD (DUF308 family)
MSNPREDLRGVIQGVALKADARLDRLWVYFIVRGCLAGLLAVFALVWPSTNLSVLLVGVGLFMVADSAVSLAEALRERGQGAGLLQCLAGAAAGLVLILWPGGTIRLLLTLSGAWALVFGSARIWEAYRAPADSEERTAVLGVGALVTVVGLVLIAWPGAGVLAIAWLIALLAGLLSALLIVIAMRLKRLQERLAERTIRRE